jgi:hypothetical protein
MRSGDIKRNIGATRRLSPFFSIALRLLPDYRVTRLFSSTSPEQSIFIFSVPLFSYISPEQPSFLTSFWLGTPFLILISEAPQLA